MKPLDASPVEGLQDRIAQARRTREKKTVEGLMALMDGVLTGSLTHPDAPSPDERVRLRARRAFEEARKVLHVEHAPWHHQELWLFAAGSSEGQDWLLKEIEWLERETARGRRRARAHREKMEAEFRRLGDEGEFVYQEGDEWF